ncbi:MAG: septum formation initiator family protein [Flavobacteriales bacterium]|nr:septum formation initiator family protein [Flavobacteriales bacterium]
MIQKIPSWLKNKYSYSILTFIIWVSFIDQNNVMTAYSYNVELRKLESEKEYFNEAIEKTSKELFDLTENPATLEKFARENYYMKKEGEEVFVFTTE